MLYYVIIPFYFVRNVKSPMVHCVFGAPVMYFQVSGWTAGRAVLSDRIVPWLVWSRSSPFTMFFEEHLMKGLPLWTARNHNRPTLVTTILEGPSLDRTCYRGVGCHSSRAANHCAAWVAEWRSGARSEATRCTVFSSPDALSFNFL